MPLKRKSEKKNHQLLKAVAILQGKSRNVRLKQHGGDVAD